MTTKSAKPLGLNAVGKPYGANYDPHYRLSFGGTKIGRLYAPYGWDMKFVNDDPSKFEDWRRQGCRGRQQKLSPVPLLDGQFEPDSVFDMAAAAKLLRGIEKLMHTLRQAMLKAAEKPEPKKPISAPTNTILEDRVQVDLIERLERVRDTLETMGSDGTPHVHFQVLADNALRAAVDYLVAQREERIR
jgi:hypothetical protein